MITTHIHLSRSYPIHLGHHILFDTSILTTLLRTLNKHCVIITNTQLRDTHGQALKKRLASCAIEADLLCIPAGESYKTRETKAELENQLLEKQYSRDTCLIALGGGVITDLVGFTAATYCRGIPVIYLPTSLLAMVDACIGGKTAVNTSHGKNMIGCFYQPHAVIIDTYFLETLPSHEWRNGIVEIIKHSLIADSELFNTLEAYTHSTEQLIQLIYRNNLIKKSITEQDEEDRSIRQLLNFGHTIGHAIEQIEQYTISHGEAVAIGIIVESYLSMQLGLLPHSAFERMVTLFKKYQLPLKTHAFDHKNTFYSALCRDKKSIQRIPQFVLLEKIGQPWQDPPRYTKAIEPRLLDQALDFAKNQFSSVQSC